MNLMRENPLVSICFTCYNRKQFIRDAFQSVLDQTYDPVEIIVSDNASTDGTKEIVLSMIDEYRNGHGKHRILLNVNADNIGGLKNSEKCFSLANGELIVWAHDDDISHPDRVEQIVNAWLSTDKQASVIAHGWRTIDYDGYLVGEQAPWGPTLQWHSACASLDYVKGCWPLGAAMAFTPDVTRRFPLLQERNAFEDVIFLFRAMMLGRPYYIPEHLIDYRIPAFGLKADVRTRQQKQGLFGMAACRVAREELDNFKKNISGEAYQTIKDTINCQFADFNNVYVAFSKGNFFGRIRTIISARNLMLQCTCCRRWLVAILLILPTLIGNPLLNVVTSLYWWRKRNVYKRSWVADGRS